MKKTTLFLIVLLVFSTMLIAGCTQQKPEVIPVTTPSVTAERTVPPQINQTVANITEKANQTVANITEKANQTVANITNQTNQTVANITRQANQTVANITDKTVAEIVNKT
ncbi:MAG: hypothetical protein LUQ37_05700 [Methanoregulaceae archaeon]|jgi:ElaB/YqjD/DUF883 family membrane-anchored ribosome-binding protein|nr:hypothetical protein [Methanoregulaceae archaeon]